MLAACTLLLFLFISFSIFIFLQPFKLIRVLGECSFGVRCAYCASLILAAGRCCSVALSTLLNASAIILWRLFHLFSNYCFPLAFFAFMHSRSAPSFFFAYAGRPSTRSAMRFYFSIFIFWPLLSLAIPTCVCAQNKWSCRIEKFCSPWPRRCVVQHFV